MRSVRWVAVAALGCASLMFVDQPAQAAVVHASTGARCTIVGTSHADHLVGTAGRDVICGGGGNDTIDGRGGDDLIDGGPGRDVVLGGSGNDRLLGGSGHDDVNGGPGSDRMAGGTGGDGLVGGLGNDAVRGQDGNDDLSGGPGADSLDGGPGTNWCTTDPTDMSNQCVYDTEAPVAHEIDLLTSSVDVSAGDQNVDVRVHLTDDTGVANAQIALYILPLGGSVTGARLLHLADGTVRDGWWEGTVTVPRWIEPGDYQPDVSLRDRVAHWADKEWATPTVHVVDDNPDESAPEVLELASPPASTVVDVRDQSQTVHMRAHLTDTVSGVAGAYFCLMRPTSFGYTNLPCDYSFRFSGTRYDGWWEGDVEIPKGSVGGDWNVAVWVLDRAHPGDPDFWMGPDNYRAWVAGTNEPRYHLLPDGAGRFSVIGTTDSAPPSLVDLTADPATVDTLLGPVTVHVSVHATDVEGVTGVGADLFGTSAPAGGGPPYFRVGDFTLVSGTPHDGVWEADVTLPQGLPPGDYYFQAWVEDATHWRSYTSAGSNLAGQPNQEVMAWDPKVTVRPAP